MPLSKALPLSLSALSFLGCAGQPKTEFSMRAESRMARIVIEGEFQYVIDGYSESCFLTVQPGLAASPTIMSPVDCAVLGRNLPAAARYITWLRPPQAPVETAPPPATPSQE